MLGGFEEVTGALLVTGYWLQRVIGSYKGSQGVTKGYRGF